MLETQAVPVVSALPVVPSPAEPAAPPTLADLLKQVITEYAAGVKCQAKHHLRAGKLAHEYVVLAKSKGLARDAAIREIERHLSPADGKRVQVNRLIGTYFVAALLAEGAAVEGVPFRLLREFSPLLKRDYATEAWAIRPGLESAARELFRRAAAERWLAPAVAQAVRELRGKQPKPGREDEEADRHNPLAALRQAEPAEVGELLAKAITDHADPAAVVEALGLALDWQPRYGTLLARALLQAGAFKTANALYLALRNAEREGGGR